jgi:hypothetical protein
MKSCSELGLGFAMEARFPVIILCFVPHNCPDTGMKEVSLDLHSTFILAEEHLVPLLIDI